MRRGSGTGSAQWFQGHHISNSGVVLDSNLAQVVVASRLYACKSFYCVPTED